MCTWTGFTSNTSALAVHFQINYIQLYTPNILTSRIHKQTNKQELAFEPLPAHGEPAHVQGKSNISASLQQTISHLHVTSLELLFKSFPVSICMLLLHETRYPIDLRVCWQQVVIVILTKQLHILMLLHCPLLCTPTIKHKKSRNYHSNTFSNSNIQLSLLVDIPTL